MRDKLKLTAELLQQLPGDQSITLELAGATWWHNIRSTGGMRLTDAGFNALSKLLNIEFYIYQIPDNMTFTQQTVLDLDRKLQHPYYIVTKKNFPVDIIFFSSSEAVLVNLYGDLEKFLDNYK
jgi:hypothetical protein